MRVHEDWIAGAPSAQSDDVEDEVFNTRPRTDIPGDDGMMDEFVTDEPTDIENPPVNDKIDELIRAVDELKTMLAPVAPILAALPELMDKVGPLIEGIENSPTLKLLGIKVKK